MGIVEIWNSIWNFFSDNQYVINVIITIVSIILLIIGFLKWLLGMKKGKGTNYTEFGASYPSNNHVWFSTHLINKIKIAYYINHRAIFRRKEIPKHHPDVPSDKMIEVNDYIPVRIKCEDIQSHLNKNDFDRDECIVELNFKDLEGTKYRHGLTPKKWTVNYV